METREILECVLAHRLKSEEKYPAKKTVPEWIQQLQDRMTQLRDWLQLPAEEASDLGTSKSAAQLAGLCVRLIEEKGLPLVWPGK